MQQALILVFDCGKEEIVASAQATASAVRAALQAVQRGGQVHGKPQARHRVVKGGPLQRALRPAVPEAGSEQAAAQHPQQGTPRTNPCPC